MKNLIILFILCVFLQSGYSRENIPIRVASYNLRYENNHDGVNSWSNRKEHVKALIQFHDFDIFGTQEGLIGQLNDIAELRQYAFTGKGRDDGEHRGEHSAIFYKKDRFKLLASGDFWLSETPDKPTIGWDAQCCKRICSWGRFKDLKTKREFYFFCVHFDHQGVNARLQSGYLMVNKIKEIAGSAHVILVGDFNSPPETKQILYIQTILNDAYRITEQPPYGPFVTTNGFQTNPPLQNRIDYIFVSKQIKVLKYGVLNDTYDQKYPSDHFPVVAQVTINH